MTASGRDIGLSTENKDLWSFAGIKKINDQWLRIKIEDVKISGIEPGAGWDCLTLQPIRHLTI